MLNNRVPSKLFGIDIYQRFGRSPEQTLKRRTGRCGLCAAETAAALDLVPLCVDASLKEPKQLTREVEGKM
ncbi:hypothetical protein EVAR_43386_1 [Eumeta japonica]|uniref:Uncharacterized protein n=1 Tax=Eumeta variegata TaxID=151549 RepID=A0A4C1WQG5_EUMVA|nr:hypothetical protein EVAR_43386_1 [Eumeta japonica]